MPLKHRNPYDFSRTPGRVSLEPKPVGAPGRSRRKFWWAGALLLALIAIIQLWPSKPPAEAVVMQTPSPVPDARWQQFHGVCDTYGVAYTDPGEDEDKRIAEFGEADTPANRTKMSFMGLQVDLHKKLAACLAAVERDLTDQATGYQIKEIGAYREERDDRPYWFHQYGGAIDINPATNPLCYEDVEPSGPEDRCGMEKPYDMPESWVTTFERYGFYWGGKFDKHKDYMHFEWHGN